MQFSFKQRLQQYEPPCVRAFSQWTMQLFQFSHSEMIIPAKVITDPKRKSCWEPRQTVEFMSVQAKQQQEMTIKRPVTISSTHSTIRLRPPPLLRGEATPVSVCCGSLSIQSQVLQLFFSQSHPPVRAMPRPYHQRPAPPPVSVVSPSF